MRRDEAQVGPGGDVIRVVSGKDPWPDDPGMTVVRQVYSLMRVDDKWSVREERGFRWWGYRQAQQVWSEPGFDDEGIEIFRVRARSDVLHGCRPSSAQLDALGLLPRPRLRTGRSALLGWDVHRASEGQRGGAI